MLLYIVFFTIMLIMALLKIEPMGEIIKRKFRNTVRYMTMKYLTGSSSSEAKLEKGVLIIPFEYHNKKYVIYVKYNKRHRGFKYIGETEDGNEVKLNVLSQIPLTCVPPNITNIYKINSNDGTREFYEI